LLNSDISPVILRIPFVISQTPIIPLLVQF